MTDRPKETIRGQRGVWTAEVRGRELPVLHDTWCRGNDYYDPMDGVKLDGKKYQGLLGALRENGVAVMQRDAGDEVMSRAGYRGLYSYRDLQVGGDGSVRLTLVNKIADPA